MSMQWFRYEDPANDVIDVEADKDGATVKVWRRNVPHRADLSPMQAESLAIALVQATPDRDRTVTIPEGVISAEDQLAVGLALIRAAGRVKEAK